MNAKTKLNILFLAGLYNLLWGAIVILFPNLFFDLSGLQRMTYPEIWQCVGMIVGVYGLGYIVAATDPDRHWPIIFVGFLGKILGPLGFIQGIITAKFNFAFGINIIFNDLIWWYPFFMILRDTYKKFYQETVADIKTVVDKYKLKNGKNLIEASQEKDHLVVFLRHAGCTFCKEMLADFGEMIKSQTYAQPVLVHMGASFSLEPFLNEYNLENSEIISDPERDLYRAFGLKRGSLWQVIGPQVLLPAIKATLNGHKLGALEGDGFQMPGVFRVSKGEITPLFIAKSSHDRLPKNLLKGSVV